MEDVFLGYPANNNPRHRDYRHYRHKLYRNAVMYGTVSAAGVYYGSKSLFNYMTNKKRKNPYKQHKGQPSKLRGTQTSITDFLIDYGDSQKMSNQMDVATPSAVASANLQKPVKFGRLQARTVKGEAGDDTFAKFPCSGHKVGRNPVKTMVDRLFPMVNIKGQGYGTALTAYYLAGVPVLGQYVSPTSTLAEAAFTPNVNKALVCVGSKQCCLQFCHLSGGTKAVQDKIPAANGSDLNTGVNFLGLINVSRDNANVASLFGTLGSTNGTRNQLYNNLEYHGGSVTHYFLNTSNVDVFFESCVCRPNKFLARAFTPLSLALYDSLSNVFNAQTLSAAESMGQTQLDDVTKPTFWLRPQHTQLMNDYDVSKSERVRIAPGQRHVITIDHPKFEFEESPFNRGLIGLSFDAATNSDKSYYPFCTSFLVCRFSGETVSNNPVSTVWDPTAAKVNTSACALAHWYRETHTLRSSIFSPPKIYIFEDLLTDTITAGATVVNQESDTCGAVDV